MTGFNTAEKNAMATLLLEHQQANDAHGATESPTATKADYDTATISVPRDLLVLGRALARQERRSFSSRMTVLLEGALMRAGWIDAAGQMTTMGKAAFIVAECREEAKAA